MSPTLFKPDHCAMLCGRPIKGNESKDHVISRGLGSYDQAFVVDRICKTCNNDYGKMLETALFRTSFYAAMRKLFGIRSRMGKSKKELDESERSDRYTSILVKHKDQFVQPVFFKGDAGPLMGLPPTCEFTYHDGAKEDHVVTGMTPAQIADFIIAKLAVKKGMVDIKTGMVERLEVLRIACERDPTLMAADMGKVLTDPDPKVPQAGQIHGPVNEFHIRAMAYLVLKSLLYAGYVGEALEHLVLFIKGEWARVQFESFINTNAASILDITKCQHRVFWLANLNMIKASIRLFELTDLSAGTGLNLAIGYERPRKVLAPGLFPSTGGIRARYYKPAKDIKPGRGWVEFYRDNKQVTTSYRDPNAAT